MAQTFPDTPRGRYASRCGGCCPVHEYPLRVSAGYGIDMDCTPTRRFEQIQTRYPWCLDIGESLTPPSYSHHRRVIVWCEVCETNASYTLGDARA